jgi:hypothetical protein
MMVAPAHTHGIIYSVSGFPAGSAVDRVLHFPSNQVGEDDD